MFVEGVASRVEHPNLGGPIDPASLSESDHVVWTQLYRHELDAMLTLLPEVEKKLEGVKTGRGRGAFRELRSICAEWTIFARYSPLNASRERAEQYVEVIREVRKWLKEL